MERSPGGKRVTTATLPLIRAIPSGQNRRRSPRRREDHWFFLFCRFEGPTFRRIFPGLSRTIIVKPLNPTWSPRLSPAPSKPLVAGKPPRSTLLEKKKKQSHNALLTSKPLSGNLRWLPTKLHVQKTPLTAGYNNRSKLVEVSLATGRKKPHKSRRYTFIARTFRRSLHRRLRPADHP